MSESKDIPTIDSNFCSGNAIHVSTTENAPGNYDITLRTRCDNEGEEFSCPKHRSWFYFRVCNVRKGMKIQFSIRNSGLLKKLYKWGHRPVFRVGKNCDWKKCENFVAKYITPKPIGGKKRKTRVVLRIIHNFLSCEDHFFAFCYPFSYEDLQIQIEQLKEEYEKKDDIYFHHDVLYHTFDGRNLDVLTISSTKNILHAEEKSLEQLYPIRGSKRARRFKEKPIYVLTSRMHSGETPSSFIQNGFIEFILHPTDPRAILLRDLYVFKCVPMLSPDAVGRGNWRFHSKGFELNDFFYRANKRKEPTVFATRLLMEYLWSDCNLQMFVDLHSHCNEKNAFVFGNALESFDDQVKNLLYPKLVSINSQHVDFDRCKFGHTRMENFTGTARVEYFVQLGMIHSYALEVNFHTGDKVNPTPIPKNPTGWLKESYYETPTRYKIEHFKDIGKGLALALLDFNGMGKKYSKLPRTSYKTLRGVRSFVERKMKTSRNYWRAENALEVRYNKWRKVQTLKRRFPDVNEEIFYRAFTKLKGKPLNEVILFLKSIVV